MLATAASLFLISTPPALPAAAAYEILDAASIACAPQGSPGSGGPGAGGPGGGGPAGSASLIKFTDASAEAGIESDGLSFGAAAGDANGDGWPDLFVSGHYSGRARLWLNLANGKFADVSPLMLPAPQGDLHGAVWSDLDADGSQELVVMRGAGYGLVPTPKLLYKRFGNVMADVAPFTALDLPLMRSRTPLALDYDDDGVMDLFLTAAARPDGTFPTGPFRQGAGHQFHGTWSTIGAGNTWSEFAVHGDLDGDRRLDLLVHGWPTRAFSYGPNGLTNITGTIGLPNATTMRDATVLDIDNDGVNEIYICRNNLGSAMNRRDSRRVELRTITVGQEHGVRLPVAGPHTLTIEWGPQGLPTPVLVGSSGAVAGPVWSLQLDPNNPAHQGIAPHVGGQVDGIYVGYDTPSASWIVLSSSTIWSDTMIRLTASVPAAPPIALGFNPQTASPSDMLLKRINGSYVDVASTHGVPADLRGHSVVAADFDNDMDLDLFVVTSTMSHNTPDIILRNDGSGQFQVTQASEACGLGRGIGDSVVSLDYDRDGRVDLFVVNGDANSFRYVPSNSFADDGPSQLFHNTTTNANHWLTIELVGTSSHSDGIGARIEVTAGGVTQLREASGGTHRYSQNHGIHFGLGSHTVADVRVFWPNGTQSVRLQQQVDRQLTIVQ